MPSIYLQPADYATYGVPNATVAEVLKASAFIDGYLNRPDGLIYVLDLAGEPVYMETTGLPITKIQVLPNKKQFMLAFTPVVKLLNVFYSDQCYSPPAFNAVTGSVTTDDGMLYLGTPATTNSIIKVQYVAGWLYATLPSAIKLACANIIQIIEEGIISSAVDKLRAGDTEIDFGASSKTTGNIYIDQATADILSPYKAVFV